MVQLVCMKQYLSLVGQSINILLFYITFFLISLKNKLDLSSFCVQTIYKKQNYKKVKIVQTSFWEQNK